VPVWLGSGLVSAVRTDRQTRGATIRLVLVTVVNRTAPGVHDHRIGDDGELLAVGKLHVVAGHGWPAASSARDAHRSCSISCAAFSASW
jgi:hypothetical protein